MQVHQVVIRPQGDSVIVLYVDQTGQRYPLNLAMGDVPAAATAVQQCQSHLPSDAEHPAKAEIQTEITELEKRITQLKQSIGAA